MSSENATKNVIDLAAARDGRDRAKRLDALARDFGRFMMVATGGGLLNARLFECHDEILGEEFGAVPDEPEAMCAACYGCCREEGEFDEADDVFEAEPDHASPP
jgi:hypothetical protein